MPPLWTLSLTTTTAVVVVVHSCDDSTLVFLWMTGWPIKHSLKRSHSMWVGWWIYLWTHWAQEEQNFQIQHSSQPKNIFLFKQWLHTTRENFFYKSCLTLELLFEAYQLLKMDTCLAHLSQLINKKISILSRALKKLRDGKTYKKIHNTSFKAPNFLLFFLRGGDKVLEKDHLRQEIGMRVA